MLGFCRQQKRLFSVNVDLSFVVNGHYDLIVIGSGPAAQRCAIASAKRGKKVAMIDREAMLGGSCVHTGTIPSKTFREAILHLTGYRHQGFYGRSYQPWHKRISIEDILTRVKKVEEKETDVVLDQLRRNDVEIIAGTAQFLDSQKDHPTRILITSSEHTDSQVLTRPKLIISADKYLIACGTRPVRNPNIEFDGKTIFDSDQLLWGKVREVPRNLIVLGAGVIGMEYASMINVIPGTIVNIIDPRPKLLDFADHEVTDALSYSMRQRGARFLLGEVFERLEKTKDGSIVVHLRSGKKVAGDALFYCMGRQGNTDSLNLSTVGIVADQRGLLSVNDFYQTTCPHIYAAGDCIGYPALASTSMEQGRRAASHMWGEGCALDDNLENAEKIKSVLQADGFLGRYTEQLFPYGIYTIPEISMVGKTEHQLTSENIPYEVGIAHYSELAKGQMLGGVDGFLKLIFRSDNLELLGIHAFGEGATEIVHIGQVVLKNKGSIEYFRNTVFNYPTLAEAYNVAAHNGLSKIQDV